MTAPENDPRDDEAATPSADATPVNADGGEVTPKNADDADVTDVHEDVAPGATEHADATAVSPAPAAGDDADVIIEAPAPAPAPAADAVPPTAAVVPTTPQQAADVKPAKAEKPAKPTKSAKPAKPSRAERRADAARARADAAEAPRTPVEPPSGGVRALRMGGRIVAGIAAAAAAAAVVTAAIVVPTPTVSASAPRAVIDPTPGDTTLVCPESFLVSGRDATQAQSFAVAGSLGADAVSIDDVTASEVGFAGIDGASTRILTAPAQDGQRTDIAGAGSLTIAQPDVAGYAAAACRPSVTEGWFVGLDTRTGSTAALVLTNPGTVSSVVTLSAYGEVGPLGADTEITVPAGQSRAIAVSALVGTEFSPVIHLATSGAAVQAVVQATAVRGLTPTGIDVGDIIRTDDLTQVIPGVLDSGAENAATAVRLLGTDTDTTAHVEFRTAAGMTVAEQDVDLVVGIPTEVAFDQLTPGTYDVVVTAEAAVVAAAWSTTGEAAGSDFAWYPAAPAVSATSTFAVAAGAQATLRLANPGESDVDVVVTSGSTKRTVTVPAGGAAEAALTAATVGTLDPGEGTVFAAVDYVVGGSIATSAVWPADSASEAVTVTR